MQLTRIPGFSRPCAALLAAFWWSVAPAAPGGFDVEVTGPAVVIVDPDTVVMVMTLNNTGASDHALASVETADAATAQLRDGKGPVERIALPAGQSTVLEAGGFHVLLTGFKQPLQPGETVNVILVFADGSRTTVLSNVRQ